MGVKGLQFFMDRCCPEACVRVNLREMARQHASIVRQSSTTTADSTGATLVVDGMACLMGWYSCKDWVQGGQWKEYMDVLKEWVEAFTSAGIRLVFFFDGVVEEQKRKEWVKRRCRVNADISKIFHHIKNHGEQPSGKLFCLPSGLATFTPFALRSLGQEVFCSVREADYEIASYARQHNCMGILGQDSDFIIYDSAPYFSVVKLWIKSLTTVMYDRQKLCQTMGLTTAQLPLLACLLGNDVVPEDQMLHIRNNAMATYGENSGAPHSGAPPRGQEVLAVSQLVSSLWSEEEVEAGLVPESLGLLAHQRDLLKKGISWYCLPGQASFELVGIPSHPPAFAKHCSAEILKACREKHVAAEGFLLYSVVCQGVTECSNTLEDEEDSELLPQALVYKPCRQRIYGLLLLLGHDGGPEDSPTIKEWFVFPGNTLKEPELVHPVPINLPCDQPSLDLLWFSSAPEVSSLRLVAFLTVFDCMELSDLYGAVEDSLLAALCLITYISLQVQTLSQEDVDAYLSQAVCLRRQTAQELQQIELPFLSSHAVQLGSLYVRGLSHLLGANSASGCPLPSGALMPWQSFDGRLFHSKYLLAHGGAEKTELLDSDSSCLCLFLRLREKLTEICTKRGRILQSRPKALPPGLRRSGQSAGSPEGWRRRGETAGCHQPGQGWRDRGEDRRERSEQSNRERPWDRRGYRGQGQRGRGEQRGGRHRGGGQQFHLLYPEFCAGGPQNMNGPQRQSRGQPYGNRGRYQMTPRWSQPPT